MSIVSPVVLSAVVTWVTPIWILGLGALVGTIVLLTLWGAMALVSRRGAVAIAQTVREGILWPLLIVILILATVGVVTSFTVNEPLGVISSVARLPHVGITRVEHTLPHCLRFAAIARLLEQSERLRGRLANWLDNTDCIIGAAVVDKKKLHIVVLGDELFEL